LKAYRKSPLAEYTAAIIQHQAEATIFRAW